MQSLKIIISEETKRKTYLYIIVLAQLRNDTKKIFSRIIVRRILVFVIKFANKAFDTYRKAICLELNLIQ